MEGHCGDYGAHDVQGQTERAWFVLFKEIKARRRFCSCLPTTLWQSIKKIQLLEGFTGI